MKNEIVFYQVSENTVRLEVRIENETVWLNRQQIASLFGRDVKTIGKHINNVFSDGELIKKVVVAKFATTTKYGAIKGKNQKFNVEYYNLDVIISVGYRVKSKQGTQFRPDSYREGQQSIKRPFVKRIFLKQQNEPH